MKKGMFAGTFDPITIGHLDIIKRSLLMVDSLLIAVYENPYKLPMLDIETRVGLITKEIALNHLSHCAKVISFNSLLVSVAKEENVIVNFRGIRSLQDYEYELNMHVINNVLFSSLNTVFLPAADIYRHISSSLVKEVAAFGGDISKFVSPFVEEEIKNNIGHGDFK